MFFNAGAQTILARYAIGEPAAPVFAISSDAIREAFLRVCKNAGVPPFTAHWLRHTAATKLADSLGVEAVQRVLGHATVAMSEHYSKAAEKKARESVKALE